uniref:Uncharacterized GPI-anchored protein At5g19230-like domain-containing protein n=1 Tax=Manihot esculenta TaxID=3983 RepID=A0A2C9VCY2_MANES
MASLKLVTHFLFLLLLAIFLLSSSVLSDGEEEIVLQGLNSFRTARGLPALTINENAACLADRFADQILEDMTCSATAPYHFNPRQLDHYPELLSKCNTNNITVGGVVLPVCVPQLAPTTVFTNYTRTDYAKYINDSSFTEAGLGSKGDWMVVVLSTSTSQNTTGPARDFALGNVLISTQNGQVTGAANSLVSMDGFGHCLMSFLLGMLFVRI